MSIIDQNRKRDTIHTEREKERERERDKSLSYRWKELEKVGDKQTQTN